MEVLLNCVKKNSCNPPVTLKSIFYSSYLPDVLTKNKSLQNLTPLTLIDAHHSDPRLILHYSGIGFYVLCLSHHHECSDNKHVECFHEFVPYPFGSSLLRVRISSSRISLGQSLTVSSGSLFAFVYGSDSEALTMGICKYYDRTTDLNPLFLQKSYDITANLFWLHSFFISQKEFCDIQKNPVAKIEIQMLVLITKKGLKLFQIENQSKISVIQDVSDLHKTRNLWFDETSCSILFEIGNGLFQPFVLDSSCVLYKKYPPINLNIPKRCCFLSVCISLITLYYSTYILAIDQGNGVICIFTFAEGKQILTLDIKGPGRIYLQQVDNVLLVHRPDRALSLLYDVNNLLNNSIVQDVQPLLSFRFSHEDMVYEAIENKDLNPIRNKVYFAETDSHYLDTTQYPENWDFESFRGMILNKKKGAIYFIELNLYSIVRQLLEKSGTPLADVISFLLRRKNSKNVLCDIVRWDLNISGGKNAFGLLMNGYSNAMSCVSAFKDSEYTSMQHSGEPQFFIQDISFCLDAELLRRPMELSDFLLINFYRQCVKDSYLNESDITYTVFRASIAQVIGFNEKSASESETCQDLDSSLRSDKSIFLQCEKQLDGLLRMCCCLLERHFKIHDSLAFLLLDLSILCMKGVQSFHESVPYCDFLDVLVQDLFQFHIITPSPSILGRLLRLWKKTHEDWTARIIYNIATQLGDWMNAALLLLDLKQYYSVLCTLQQHKIFEFPLHLLLKTLSEDIESQLNDPDLLEEVVLWIRYWLTITAIPCEGHSRIITGTISLPKRHLLRCNVTNCESWFPELIDTEAVLRDEEV